MSDPDKEQVLSWIGLKRPPRGFGWSKAESYIYSQAMNDMRSQTPEEQQHLHTLYQTRAKMLNDEITPSQVTDLVDQGKLTPKDLDSLVGKEQLSMLQLHFDRLKYKQALHAFELASPSEQDALRPFLVKKLNNIPPNDDLSREKYLNLLDSKH